MAHPRVFSFSTNSGGSPATSPGWSLRIAVSFLAAGLALFACCAWPNPAVPKIPPATIKPMRHIVCFCEPAESTTVVISSLLTMPQYTLRSTLPNIKNMSQQRVVSKTAQQYNLDDVGTLGGISCAIRTPGDM